MLENHGGVINGYTIANCTASYIGYLDDCIDDCVITNNNYEGNNDPIINGIGGQQ